MRFLPLYILVSCFALSSLQADEGMDFFESEIRPLLIGNCYKCHSHEKKIKGGLALDSLSGWKKGGDNGPAIVPGKADESLLIKAVTYADSDLEMPPKKKLSHSEINTLKKWIAMGAPDPRRSAPALTKRVINIETGRKHWAFQAVRDPVISTVKDANWPLDKVDAFLLARLEQDNLQPAGDADRFIWLRRVSLDLTGLPPTPEEVKAFIADDSESAFAIVVDRLLDSRAFGERWARHWLDLTGYADQIGSSNNIFAEHAWRYRDYLIDAFNTDKPFDRFVREQIAGDLLPAGSVEETAANLTATGFLVLGDVEVVEADKEKMRVDLIDRQVSKVGTAFLGMTLGCARCHDHKFDPIPATDYYAMAGIFESTQSTYKFKRGVWSSITTAELPETDSQKTQRAITLKEHSKKLTVWKRERDQLQKQVDALEKDSDERKKQQAKIKSLKAKIEHAEFFTPSVPRTYAVSDVAEPGDMRITIRGNPHARGDSVPRGFLQVASRPASVKIPTDQSGRLQLADWIVAPENPLTARVTVNRIWQKLFGEGLVGSVDYFGLRGETPSHPELLDHLATRFIRGGWSQKKLIHDLVLSRAYRMSGAFNPKAAAIDPANRLLWRMNGQRLDAESIRDSLLAVAGTLQGSEGGPALPLEYLENVTGIDPKNVNPPAFRLKKYRPAQAFQRTIYLPIIRSGAQPGPAELRNLFDFTQPAEIVGRRATTAVPTQALFLMNGDILKKRADELASRVSKKMTKGNTTNRIEQIWLLVYGRPITETERVETLAFLKLQPDEKSGWSELCHALLASNEFLMRL